MKNSASFDTKIVSLPIFSGYDQNLSYIYCTINFVHMLFKSGLLSQTGWENMV